MPNAEVRPTERRTLHFSLPAVEPDDPLTLHVALRKHTMRVHDAGSRLKARDAHPFLRAVPDHLLTHFIDADLPLDAVAMIEVTKPVMVDGQEAEHTVHLAIHVPSAGEEAAIRRLRSANAPLWPVHPKLLSLQLAGVNASDIGDTVFPEGMIDWNDPTEASVALLFQHPDLLNLSVDHGGELPAYIKTACVMTALTRTSMSLPAAIYLAGSKWMKTEPAKGPDGKPLIDPVTGQPVMTRILHKTVADAIEAPLKLAVKLAKDDTFLKNQQWTLQYGRTTDTYGARSVRGTVQDEPVRESAVLRAPEGSFNWALKNLTPGSGLSIDWNIQYNPAPSQQTFTVNDIWMSTDAQPLDAKAIAELLAGKVSVILSDAKSPKGAARADLVPAAPPKDGEPVAFTAKFNGSAKVEGTFRLNDLRTAVTFNISATGLGAGPNGVFAIAESGEAQRNLRAFVIDDASRNGTLTVRCKNEWLRHLSAHVQFRDGANKVIAPTGWSEKIPSGLQKIFQQDPNTKFVDLVPPVRTVFGVPIPPEPTTISFPVPPEASKVVLNYGGLGYGGSYDTAVCPIGVAVTVVAEMAVPVTLLLAGTAVTNSKTVVALLEDKETLFAICTVAGFLVAGSTAAYIGTAQDSTAAIKDVAITLGPMLLSPATALGRWLLQKVAEGAAQRAAPFLNVFTTIVSGAVTAAQLSQTIIEVLSSPWKYEVEITRSINIEVTLEPDRVSHVFPDLAVRYVVSVVYDSGATIPQQEFTISGRKQDPITVTFYSAPAGGRVKAYAVFYADNGWQAGQGDSAWFDAKGTDGSTLKMGFDIKTNEVPLTIDSVYKHKGKMGFNPQLKQHQWIETTTPPDKTRVSPSPFEGKIIQRLMSITTATRTGMIGYSWQATGLHVPADRKGTPPVDGPLYTVQNLSALGRPEEGYAVPPVGFSVAAGVLYDPTSPEDGTGRNFFVDSSRGEFDKDRAGSGLHLRRIALKYDPEKHKAYAPDLDTQTGKSWGRFPVAVDRYILHPQGVVIGISFNRHKLFLLNLPAAPVEDEKAPLATMASGEGFRDGLINGPRAIATGLDGRVLILEAVNARIQAFDIHGNPVPYFGPKADQPYMQLRKGAESQFLDLAVEAKGYLYVLRFTDESKPEKYFVDIYEPNGNFLVETPNFAADKLTVDLMRNLFALNYEIFEGKDGRPEPSVSQWIPPAPKQ